MRPTGTFSDHPFRSYSSLKTGSQNIKTAITSKRIIEKGPGWSHSLRLISQQHKSDAFFSSVLVKVTKMIPFDVISKTEESRRFLWFWQNKTKQRKTDWRTSLVLIHRLVNCKSSDLQQVLSYQAPPFLYQKKIWKKCICHNLKLNFKHSSESHENSNKKIVHTLLEILHFCALSESELIKIQIHVQ
jgi:hypothetical protein